METIEVLQKYPNCKVNAKSYGKGKVVQLDFTDDPYASFETNEGDWFYNVDIRDLTPILRPMSSMTEEEKKKAKGMSCNLTPEMAKYVDYLRSISIDIDNLIEQGKAEAQQ